MSLTFEDRRKKTRHIDENQQRSMQNSIRHLNISKLALDFLRSWKIFREIFSVRTVTIRFQLKKKFYKKL